MTSLRSIIHRTITTTTRRNMSSPTPAPSLPTLRNPLLVITGSTGTGKSNLAVSLALALHPQAEIINADAMQLYSGLPITTNKMPFEERMGIPHHLLGAIGLDEEPWTVKKFVCECDRVIGEIRGRGKVPIVVGGTGYYVHGLILGGTTLDDGGREEGEENGTEREGEGEGKGTRADEGVWAIMDASTEDIYAKLQEIDPVMARRWHPSDRRKIQRSLEIWLKTGKKASDVYAEQKRGKACAGFSENMEDGIMSSSHEQLRYDPLIFWLDAEDAALKDRLNRRVGAMVQSGLVDEAKQMAAFEQEMQQKGVSVDKSKGIWVSIGYKELEPWLEQVKGKSEVTKTAVALQQSCIEAIKASTRRYAKRQNRYIRIRLAQALAQANVSDKLFLLDCTDLADWQHSVIKPAHDIVNAFLEGRALPKPSDLSDLAQETFAETAEEDGGSLDRIARRCETCDKILMTEKEWLKHINSRSHKKILEGIRRRALNGEHQPSWPPVGKTNSVPGCAQAPDTDPK